MEDEDLISLAEFILSSYAPYGLNEAQIKVLAKAEVDGWKRSES